MKNIVLLTVLAILLSCGKIADLRQIPDIHYSDSHFDQFKLSFNDMSNKVLGIEYDLSIPIYYDYFDADSMKIAICVMQSFTYISYSTKHNGFYKKTVHRNEIVVNGERFDKLSFVMQDYVIKHELGHCILNRDHDDRVYRNGNYYSMMNSVLMSEGAYLQNFDAYQIELFKGAI